MTAYQPRSRSAHHNDQTRGGAANRRADGATPVDAVDVATCRLKLTGDGWYLDALAPQTIADPRGIARGSVRRGEPRPERPGPVVVIAVVPHRGDPAGHDAIQAATDAIRSAVRSYLDWDDLQVELTVVGPEADRDG